MQNKQCYTYLMELNSLSFILLIMPVFILLMYFIKNNLARNIIITFFSLSLYALSDLKYLLLILLVGLLTYFVGLKVNKSKKLYYLYLIVIVLILSFFKYGNYFVSSLQMLNIEKIIMPVGISFYIFTSIAYVSDIYYGKIEADRNLINIITFLTFFPTVTSGPILRYRPFKEYLDNKNINLSSMEAGFKRFVIGLFKKVVIANQIAVASNICFSLDTKLSFILAWFGSLCFMLQLYYDFSGYSDMAIGIAKMIGFDIAENFNDPYTALSIQDFWHRWHISLSSWFKDYVYIPLGGNRVGHGKWLINTMLVWLLTGIWHGSTINYLFWGIWNGIFIILHKEIFSKIKFPKWLMWLFTQLIVMLGFTIFHTSGVDGLKTYLLALIGKGQSFSLIYIKQLDILYLWFYIALAIIFIIPFFKKVFYSIEKKAYLFYDAIIMVLLFISIVFIVSGSYSAFIYAGF